MPTYGEDAPSQSPQQTPPAKTSKDQSKQAEQARNGCIGCLAVLLLMGGCSAIIGLLTPEDLTKKCEKDLKDRYSLANYTARAKTGFITISEPVEPTMVQVISWQFYYSNPSVKGLEKAAPVYKGLATCRIEVKTKKVKSAYERISMFPDELFRQ